MKKRLTATREVLQQLQQDYYVCTKCKLCQASHVQYCVDERFWRNCPSGTRFKWEAYYASGKLEMARGLHIHEIEPDERMKHALYTCTLCANCQEMCWEVKQIHPAKVFELMREKAVKEGWGPMPEHKALQDSLEENDNPWGYPKDKRGDWTEGLGLKDLSNKKNKAEVLFWAGSVYAYDPRMRESLKAGVNMLKDAGLDLGTLGKEELDSGAVALLMGDRDLFETFAMENIERINALGIKKIVIPDTHDAWVMKEEYKRELNPEIKVKHLLEELQRLVVKEKKIVPKKEIKMKVAYHDPCKLGRRFDYYNQPRKILKKIPGLELLEFPRATFQALCCGGGGAVPYAFPDYALWTAKERLYEAEWVGADAIVTACPYCVQMFEKAIEAKDSKIKVYDFAEFLAKAL